METVQLTQEKEQEINEIKDLPQMTRFLIKEKNDAIAMAAGVMANVASGVLPKIDAMSENMNMFKTMFAGGLVDAMANNTEQPDFTGTPPSGTSVVDGKLSVEDAGELQKFLVSLACETASESMSLLQRITNKTVIPVLTAVGMSPLVITKRGWNFIKRTFYTAKEEAVGVVSDVMGIYNNTRLQLCLRHDPSTLEVVVRTIAFMNMEQKRTLVSHFHPTTYAIIKVYVVEWSKRLAQDQVKAENRFKKTADQQVAVA